MAAAIGWLALGRQGEPGPRYIHLLLLVLWCLRECDVKVNTYVAYDVSPCYDQRLVLTLSAV